MLTTAGSLSRSFWALFVGCCLACGPAKAELTQAQVQAAVAGAIQDYIDGTTGELLFPVAVYDDQTWDQLGAMLTDGSGYYIADTVRLWWQDNHRQMNILVSNLVTVGESVESIDGKIHNSLFSPDAILVADEDAEKSLESISSDASLIRGISSQMSDSWTDTFDLNQGQLITDGNDSQKGPAVRVRDYMLDQTLQALFAELEDFLQLQNSSFAESINQGTSNVVYTAGQQMPENVPSPDDYSGEQDESRNNALTAELNAEQEAKQIADENNLSFLTEFGTIDGDAATATATFDTGSTLSSLEVQSQRIIISNDRIRPSSTRNRLEPIILERSQLWAADSMAAHVKPWVDAVWTMLTALAIGMLIRDEWNRYMGTSSGDSHIQDFACYATRTQGLPL